MTATAKPIAAYLRISLATESSVSLAKQRAAIKAWLTAKGWTSPVVWFEDANVSGSKDIKRPARDDMEQRIRDGEFSALVVNNIDRLARNTGDFDRILRTAENAGCAVVIVQEGFDTSSPWGLAMAKIVAVLAELEAKNIGMRVTASNITLRQQGRRHGGKTAFGFENIPNPTGPGYVLGVREDQAVYVREAVERVLDGESMLAIARDFTARGQAFVPSTLGRLLRRPTLYGATPVGDDVLRRDGEPIIGSAAILDRETWNTLQDVLDGRLRPGNRRVRNLPLLHGIARCSGCGGTLNAHRSDTARNYHCKNADCAARVSIKLDLLDDHVVAQALADYGDEQLYRTVRIGGVDMQALTAIDTALGEVGRQIMAKDADVVGLLARRDDLLARQAELEKQTGPRVVRRPTGQTFAQAYRAALSVEDRRGILSAVVSVTIAKGKRGGAVKAPFDPARVTIAAA